MLDRILGWRPNRGVKVLLLVASLCAAALAAYLLRTPSRAVSILKISGIPPLVVGPTIYNERLVDQYRATQSSLITSPVVLNPVLARPEVAAIPSITGQSNPLKYLQSRLAVTWLGDSDLAEVSFSEHTDDPRQLVDVLNAVLTEYLGLQSSSEALSSRVMLQVLQVEDAMLTKSVEQLEDQLSRLEAEAEQTSELKKKIRHVKRELALEEEFLRTIQRRRWVLRTNQRAPSRVMLMSAASLETDGTTVHWWDSLLNW